jgi:hypothetical protein
VLGYILKRFFTNSSGADVVILKIFSPKKIGVLTENKAKLHMQKHNIDF